jgi:hypothetical protein
MRLNHCDPLFRDVKLNSYSILDGYPFGFLHPLLTPCRFTTSAFLMVSPESFFVRHRQFIFVQSSGLKAETLLGIISSEDFRTI